MNINTCIVSGNLTRDPVMRPNSSGDGGVLSFSIASNERYRDSQTGEYTEHPNYFDCTVFGRRATALQNLLHKGMKVCVRGHLHYSTYQSKQDGSTRHSIQIYVDDLDFFTPRSGEQGTAEPKQDTAPAQRQQGQYGNNAGRYQAPAQPEVGYANDDDLPF